MDSGFGKKGFMRMCTVATTPPFYAHAHRCNESGCCCFNSLHLFKRGFQWKPSGSGTGEGGWGCTAGRVGGAAQQGRWVELHSREGAWVGLHSREGGWGWTAGRVCAAGRVCGAAHQGGVELHSREGVWSCTAGRVCGAAQQGGLVGLHSREGMWAGFLPFPLPRWHPPLSMPSCPQIPSSTPTSSPYSIILFADCDHWTGSLPWCKVLRMQTWHWNGTS